MAKFAIECPKCGSINTASTSIFSKKIIKCGTCKHEFDVNTAKTTSKICPHCGKTFVYDQSKAKNNRCPSCGKIVDIATAATAESKLVKLNCPQCSCSVEVDKTRPTAFCPICNCHIETEKELLKSKLVNDDAVSVIQYEGDNSVFVWKHPIEDFNFGSQLIVHESQEAIFFLDGQALDLFGPGRHSLKTENLPRLKKLYETPEGGQTPFHCEIYFINKTVQMGIKWGTDSRVRFMDPIAGIPLDIGASGEINLQVSDARKLLVKLVGTTGGLTNKQILSAPNDENGRVHGALQGCFRAPLMTIVKSELASAIKAQNINILEIDQKMSELSELLRDKVIPVFEEYGLTVPHFYVTRILLPENDKNFVEIKNLISEAYLRVRREELETDVAEAARKRQILEAQTKADLEIIKAKGEAEAYKVKGFAEADVMEAKGYNQKDLIDADVQKTYAEGMGKMASSGGGAASDILGVVAGVKMAEKMMEQMDSNINIANRKQKQTEVQSTSATLWECECGEKGNTGNFCMHCGKPRFTVWECECGEKGNTGNFCMHCGKPRPTVWDCACGKKGNTSKFCSDCGVARP